MADFSSVIPTGLSRYQTSGKAPVAGLAAGLAAGVATAMALSIVYAAASIYIPIVQLAVLVTVGYGAAIGGVTTAVMRSLKVRNRWAPSGASAVLGVFAWAIAWYPWLYITFNRFEEPVGVIDLLNPFFVVGAIGVILDNGTWSIGHSSDSAVSGGLLAVIWVAEFAAIVGTSVAVAWAMMKDRVFCERCETWCAVEPNLRHVPDELGASLRDALVGQGDVGPILAAPVPDGASVWLTVKVGYCPSCSETNVVAFDRQKQSVDRRGRATVTTTEFVPFHHVSAADMARLRQR